MTESVCNDSLRVGTSLPGIKQAMAEKCKNKVQIQNISCRRFKKIPCQIHYDKLQIGIKNHLSCFTIYRKNYNII